MTAGEGDDGDAPAAGGAGPLPPARGVGSIPQRTGAGAPGGAAAESASALAIAGAAKRFGPCVALADATLQVRRGTVHAVVGENGAGKSTLLKIVFGLIRADRGELAIGGAGVDVARHTPARARARGVGMVQQHGALVPSLTVVENTMLGRERGFVLDLARSASELASLARDVGLELDPYAVVEKLPVAVRQRAEIVGELAAGAEVLILDEPTAVLAPVEVDRLFATLRALRARGKTVVLVTHKLDEVRAIADEITVLRRGRTVARFPGDAPTSDVARAIVGGAPPVVGARLAAPAADAAVALRVDRLAVGDRLRGIDLSIRAGEIVGVAGVEGNGQTELAAAIAGLVRADGAIAIGRRTITATDDVAARQALSLAHIPEDRHERGLVLDADIRDNLVLGRRDLAPRFWRDRGAETRATADAIRAFDVRPADPDAIVRSLSGGNQQKVVVARELGRPGLVAVVAAHPTRGVDLGAVALIHAQLRAVAAAGAGVLLVSADLDELLTLAHRVVVLYRGRIVGETRPDAPGARDQIGAWMIGGTPADAAGARTPDAADARTPDTTDASDIAATPDVADARTPDTTDASDIAATPDVAGARTPDTSDAVGARTPDAPDAAGARTPDAADAADVAGTRTRGRWQELEVAVVALLLVLAAGSLLMLVFGQSPARVWGLMITRTFGDASSLGDVVYRSTALCLTGLAVALALDAGLFNIGVEGQMAAGIVACASAGAALSVGTPAVIAIPVCVIAAAVAGGMFGAGGGELRARRHAHEVITGIMVNEIIAQTALWLGNAVIFEGGTTHGARIVPGAELAPIGLGGSAASAAVFVAIAVAVGLWLVRARSHWGARWRAVGAAPEAAENLGIPVKRVRVRIMMASGAIAGLAATGLVMGHKHGFEEGLGRGVGFLGVAVGLLGRRHPLGVVAASVALGFLSQGGLVVADQVPKELTELLIGLSVLAVAISAPLVARLRR